MCLLEACLSKGHMPTPEEAVTEAQNDGKSPPLYHFPPAPANSTSQTWLLHSWLALDTEYDQTSVDFSLD